jgi:DNA helicase MCM9
LIRIAQAHARLMFHQSVELSDAIMAVVLMEASIESSALLGCSSPLHTTFAPDPDAQCMVPAFVAQQWLFLALCN